MAEWYSTGSHLLPPYPSAPLVLSAICAVSFLGPLLGRNKDWRARKFNYELANWWGLYIHVGSNVNAARITAVVWLGQSFIVKVFFQTLKKNVTKNWCGWIFYHSPKLLLKTRLFKTHHLSQIHNQQPTKLHFDHEDSQSSLTTHPTVRANRNEWDR